MNNQCQILAPAKVHLLGEHVVVYGKPSIISAIDKHIKLTVSESNDENILITSDYLKSSETKTYSQVLAMIINAKTEWTKFNQTNEINFIKRLTINPLDYAFLCVGNIIHKHNLKNISLKIQIESDIPVGATIGSSSALAVAISAGIYQLFVSQDFDKNNINDLAFECEKFRHGYPSGGDNSASCFGGLIWYRKEAPDLKIIKPITMPVSENIAGKIILINTGKPDESTGEMVSQVRNLYNENPIFVKAILDSQEELVRSLFSVLQDGDCDAFLNIIRQGELNLEKLDVVSSRTKDLINAITAIGGSAKVCGAGGKKQGSGMVLSYHEDSEKLIHEIQKFNLDYFSVKLASPGVKISNI